MVFLFSHLGCASVSDWGADLELVLLLSCFGSGFGLGSGIALGLA